MNAREAGKEQRSPPPRVPPHIDARETATVLYNTVSHTYRHLRVGHGWSPSRAHDGVVRLVLEGIVAG